MVFPPQTTQQATDPGPNHKTTREAENGISPKIINSGAPSLFKGSLSLLSRKCGKVWVVLRYPSIGGFGLVV